MRTDRLDSVGHFVLVLVHILAHIKAGNSGYFCTLSLLNIVPAFAKVTRNDSCSVLRLFLPLCLGDLQDDSNPNFAREFYRAISVVCDDLFFARYRRSSSAAKTLAHTNDVNVESAADTLLSIMFGDAPTEEEKVDVVKELLDTRILPGTDGKGVTFTRDRVQERYK